MPVTLGRYRLIRRIAVGGMAEIFLATVEGVEGFAKSVVVKRMLPDLAHDSEFVKMFVDEAKLAAELSHPNIVHVHELSVSQRRYFMALEYVDGVDLGRLLLHRREHGLRLAPRIALLIATEIAAALHYAHTRRDPSGEPLELVHRDVSPQNILLSGDGHVKLTDFGIAKARVRASRTRGGELKGKLVYMSPEQAAGAPVDGRSDLFSLALVLYEMLAGKRAYSADDDVQALAQARAAAVEPLGVLNPEVPPALAAVVHAALAPTPSERFATGAALSQALLETGPCASAEELAALVQELPRDVGDDGDLVEALALAEARQVVTRAPPPSGGAGVLSRRRWLAPRVVGLGFLVAAAGTLAAWRFGRSPPVTPEIAEVAVGRAATLAAPPTAPQSASSLAESGGSPSPPIVLPPPPSATAAIPAARVAVAKAPRSAPAAAKTGSLTVNSSPWSYVWVDGKKQPTTTPLRDIVLPAGPHTVRLVSPGGKRETQMTVDILPGQNTTKIIDFSDP